MKFTLDTTGARAPIGAIRMFLTGVLTSVKSVSKVSHGFDAANDAGNDGVSDAVTIDDIASGTASGESLVADEAVSVILGSPLDTVHAADFDAADDAADNDAGSFVARVRWGNNSSTSKSTREFIVAMLISLRGGVEAEELAPEFSVATPSGGLDLGGFGSGGHMDRGRDNHSGPL